MEFIGLFLIVYFACGIYSHYLEYNVSPKTLAGMIKDRLQTDGGLPWRAIDAFIDSIFAWPFHVEYSWIESWQRYPSKRTGIILFLFSVIAFSASWVYIFVFLD